MPVTPLRDTLDRMIYLETAHLCGTGREHASFTVADRCSSAAEQNH